MGDDCVVIGRRIHDVHALWYPMSAVQKDMGSRSAGGMLDISRSRASDESCGG